MNKGNMKPILFHVEKKHLKREGWAMNGRLGKNGLTALAVEARRRGMSYGQLVAATTASEQQEIIQKYMGGTKEPIMERIPKQEGERICPAH